MSTRPTCSFAGCSRSARTRGWCGTHYERWRKNGTVDLMPRSGPVLCSVPKCSEFARSKGMCPSHYMRERRYGDPLGGGLRQIRGTVEERLLKMIEIDPITGCWIWSRDCTDFGYGQMSVDGHPRLVHQVSYETFIGPRVVDMLVLHRCDNPPCCNPEHLYLGTAQDNMNDMVARGRDRKARGEASGTAKLTEQQVREIRASDLLLRQLVERYGVSERTIIEVRARRTWKHVK